MAVGKKKPRGETDEKLITASYGNSKLTRVTFPSRMLVCKALIYLIHFSVVFSCIFVHVCLT